MASPDTSLDRAAASERSPRHAALQRALVRHALAKRGFPPLSVLLWNGLEIPPASGTPVARLRLHDWRVLRDLALRPDPGVGEAYASGRLVVEGDLLQLMEAGFRAAPAGRDPLGYVARALGGLFRSSRRRARRNIHHHYDIGNAFYQLWLDERLLYTCAYFPRPEASLEQAQLAKMEHVCRKLALREGERVVEAGCGWGSLALHMAERHGVRVRAFNISEQQIAFAREEARRRGLASRVEFVLDDYRNIRERCDAFVSVGMLEHVGRTRYGTLSRVIDRSLEPHGRGLIHSIGRHRPMGMSPWLQRDIFPGAYIPSLREMMAIFEPRDFAVLDVENLRLHYARTLEHWLDRFEKVADRVESMFDARFVRIWRLYLVSSLASFRTGNSHLYQVLFSRAANDRIPWTRAGVYAATWGH